MKTITGPSRFPGRCRQEISPQPMNDQPTSRHNGRPGRSGTPWVDRFPTSHAAPYPAARPAAASNASFALTLPS